METPEKTETLDELAANRDWLTEIRPAWEAESQLPEIEGIPPATNEGLAQCMMRLLNLTLDYYVDGHGGISQEDHERHMKVAITLGKEWSGTLAALPGEERFWPSVYLGLYPVGIAWIVTRTATDRKLTWFVGCVLSVWGAFNNAKRPLLQ